VNRPKKAFQSPGTQSGSSRAGRAVAPLIMAEVSLVERR
jgi:hypothetical protein